ALARAPRGFPCLPRQARRMARCQRRAGSARRRRAALPPHCRELPQVRRRPRLLDCAASARALRLQGRAARNRRCLARPSLLHVPVRLRRLRAARRPGSARSTLRIRHLQRRLPDFRAAPRAPFPPPPGCGQIVTDTLSRKTSDLERLLVRVALEHAPAALASSLSAEDMVITDVILRHKLDIEIFTLDTQRLHADTLNVIAAIRARYGYEVHVFHPDPES